VTSPAVDQGIENTNDILGFFLLTAGLAAAVFGLSNRLQRWLLGGAFAILLSINLLVWKEHFWQVGQLLELSVLTASPLVYLYYGAAGAQQRASAYRLIRWLIALTFIGHGLYAVGFHAVPANFVLMVQAGLGVGEGVARDLLLMVGFLDFIAAALLLLPFREARRAALLWDHSLGAADHHRPVVELRRAGEFHHLADAVGAGGGDTLATRFFAGGDLGGAAAALSLPHGHLI